MASKPKKPAPIKAMTDQAPRTQRGRTDRSAMFPVAAQASDMPADYAAWLAEIKGRIHGERLRLVLASNSVMVLLYWDIGQRILHKQAEQGYGTRVVDRLAADLRDAFPDMKGFSPRNLKYMRAFAAAWPDRELVQQTAAQVTWYHNLTLLEKLPTAEDRLWYARKTACWWNTHWRAASTPSAWPSGKPNSPAHCRKSWKAACRPLSRLRQS
jgi:predicted nuclease of restriction endonuclease-like (RecB) superfamily